MYLEHEWEFAVHILLFCCTSQHYETVEYEHHRTTDGGETGIYFLSTEIHSASAAVVYCQYYSSKNGG